MAKVQLEFSRETELGELIDLCEEYNLDFRVVEYRDPIGGNPIIEFIGDDVEQLINESEYDEYDY